jgi:hypothetical protein
VKIYVEGGGESTLNPAKLAAASPYAARLFDTLRGVASDGMRGPTWPAAPNSASTSDRSGMLEIVGAPGARPRLRAR